MVTSGVLQLKELISLYFSSLLCRDRWQMYWKRLRFKGHCVFSGLWLYLPSADNASNRPSIHSAVDALHTAGIIHGDIALHNVVIQPAGTAILTLIRPIFPMTLKGRRWILMQLLCYTN